MNTCRDCGQPVIIGKYGAEGNAAGQTIVLDCVARTFAAIDDGHVDARDGDRLFQSNAFVEHRFVCRGKREQGGKR